MSNNISKLQDVLFDTLTKLKDPENPMELERASTICEVSNVLISSAKAEIDFVRAAGMIPANGPRPGSTFFNALQLATPGDQIPPDHGNGSGNTSAATVTQTSTGHLTAEGNKTTHKMR